jgi:SAM-dependent methyltransferase
MQDVFAVRLAPALTAGVRILDVGAGRAPTIAVEDRPPGCRYVGLDSSAGELAAAPDRAYDEAFVHDVMQPLGRDGEFDVAVSWQVLEHVERLAPALENLRAALRVGGTLVAQLSGRYSLFAVISQLLPHRARVWAMTRWLGEPAEEKFPTHYDDCSADRLRRLLAPWSTDEVLSFYRGASYLTPLRPIQRAYLAYESALARRDARNFATHYLIIAKR